MPTFTGDNGDNRLIGGADNDRLIGLGGADVLVGNGGADELEGGDGDDLLFAHDIANDHAGDSDRLFGDNGNDTLFIGYGDFADGGSGFDRIHISYAASPVRIVEDTSAILNGAPLMPGAANAVNVEQIRDITLSRFNDSLVVGGNFAGGVVYAGDGNDYVVGQGSPGDRFNISPTMSVDGQGGNDILIGSFGRDILAGGAGADYLHGGPGNDDLYSDQFFSSDRGLDRDRLNGGPGDDQLFFGWGDEADGGEGYDTAGISFSTATSGVTIDTGTAYQSIERISLFLSSYDDVVVVGTYDGITQVSASFGNDTVIGQGSSIHVDGSQGDDLLVGSTADDLLVGGPGNDRLIGGFGKDELWGREGNDIFYFTNTDLGDRIADFQGQNDKIDLTAIDANVLLSGKQAFTFLGEAAFNGVAGQLRVFAGPNDTYFVAGDVDGDRNADLLIEVGFYDDSPFVGPPPLVASDFVLN